MCRAGRFQGFWQEGQKNILFYFFKGSSVKKGSIGTPKKFPFIAVTPLITEKLSYVAKVKSAKACQKVPKKGHWSQINIYSNNKWQPKKEVASNGTQP